jgi:bifunctional N6-L-threonylcarbamoyladenine synthase / protein kinase Bud32
LEVDGRLAIGAEATIQAAQYLGQAVLEKRRVAKSYRHPALDRALRASRTRDEANLLMAARRAGVMVPLLYDVDRGEATLSLEPIAGVTLREVLATTGDVGHMEALGCAVARLHEANVTHGDLTTSNVLVPDPARPDVVLIDFGLGQMTEEAEPRGVDLHLLEEALEATQADARRLFASFVAAYEAHAPRSRDALQRLEEIRQRGRYR